MRAENSYPCTWGLRYVFKIVIHFHLRYDLIWKYILIEAHVSSITDIWYHHSCTLHRTHTHLQVLHINDIPLQPHTGKVDQTALRRVYEKSFNRQSSQELSLLDEKERKAANIISLNLSVPNHAIDRRKSFFELGGNSINMVTTIVQLKGEYLTPCNENQSNNKIIIIYLYIMF